MCTNGINTGQFEQMIEQIDEAGDAGFATVCEKLHAAQALLDEVRAALDEAKDALEDDAAAGSNVTVSLV